MSQHFEQQPDPMAALLRRVTQGFSDIGSTVLHGEGEGVQISVEPSAEATIEQQPGLIPGSDAEATFMRLADEMLLRAERTAVPEVRDALAYHLGTGMYRAVERGTTTEAILSDTDETQEFLKETEVGIRDGSLLAALEEEVAEREQLHAEPPVYGPIARWQARRAEARAASLRYEQRQEEFRQEQVDSLPRGALSLARLQSGDVLSFTLKTPSLDPKVATTTITGTVLGREQITEGEFAGNEGIALTVKEEERSRRGKFLGFSKGLPGGTRVVIAGTAAAGNGVFINARSLLAGQLPVVLLNGKRIPFAVTSEFFRDTRNLRLHTMTVNDVEVLHVDKVVEE